MTSTTNRLEKRLSQFQAKTSEQFFAAKNCLDIYGHRMAYIDEGEGVPIIFQHGNPTFSYLWRNVMRHQRGQGKLIAVDFMEIGESRNRFLDCTFG